MGGGVRYSREESYWKWVENLGIDFNAFMAVVKWRTAREEEPAGQPKHTPQMHAPKCA